MPMKPFNGSIAGYDPGGNSAHGLAITKFVEGKCEELNVQTHRNTESVLRAIESYGEISAIGIDTLAAWSTGDSGWRQADLWLRRTYKQIQSSIVSPNGLYGSMGLNGMAALTALRQINPAIQITETHPKVLYWALKKKKYDYRKSAKAMDADLSMWLGLEVSTRDDHQWDAVVSALAAFKGITGEWNHNLFGESQYKTERLVFPAGPSDYWWPE